MSIQWFLSDSIGFTTQKDEVPILQRQDEKTKALQVAEEAADIYKAEVLLGYPYLVAHGWLENPL